MRDNIFHWLVEYWHIIVGFILIILFLLVPLYLSTSELCRVVRLNKKGIRTYGTLIRRATGRGASYVAYRVDGRKYECKSDSQLNRYEIGCDKVPVLYDTEKPENSCVEKHDFLPATALIIAFVFLETGTIIITVYLCCHIFS